MNKDTLVLRLYAKDFLYTAIRRHGLKPNTQINPGDIKLHNKDDVKALLDAVEHIYSIDVWEVRVPKNHNVNEALTQHGDDKDSYWLLKAPLPPELVVNVMRIEKNRRYKALM